MNRRTYLATATIAFTTLAGCGDTDTDTGNGGGTGNGNGGGNGGAADDGGGGGETTAEQESAPAEQSFSGEGQTVSEAFGIDGGLTVVELTHDGDSNFQVELVDEATGDTAEFLANEIGSWQAVQPYHVPEGEYVLDVNADGAWTIDVAQPRPASGDAESPPASLGDSFPNYLGPIQFDGRHTITGTYSGDSNFAVWVLGEDGSERDLVFNEIGAFEGEGSYSGDHVGYVRVESTGEWTIEIE